MQSGRLVMMGWEDMTDIDQNPSRNCLSLSTGMKPSGGCFTAPVPIGSDRAIRNLQDCTECFSSLKHPPDGFIPALKDGQFLDGFGSISAISSDGMITSLRDRTECFSSLFFTFGARFRMRKLKFLLGQLPLSDSNS